MADVFTPLTDVPPAADCPDGYFSQIIGHCLSREDWLVLWQMSVSLPGVQQALYNEAREAGVNPDGWLSGVTGGGGLLGGLFGGLLNSAVNLAVILIGIGLVFVAISSWLNVSSVNLSGVKLNLPKV